MSTHGVSCKPPSSTLYRAPPFDPERRNDEEEALFAKAPQMGLPTLQTASPGVGEIVCHTPLPQSPPASARSRSHDSLAHEL